MPRILEKLTPLKVKRITKPGWHGDGGNLYLQVTQTGVKSWIFRYTADGKKKVLGLGPTHAVNLAEAREAARTLRNKVVNGIDPAAERQARKLASDRIPTFSTACASYIAAKKHEWSNEKHAAQWTATLGTYAAPIIGSMKISAVETADVLRVLEAIWTSKPETASRVRQRMEKVFGWATTAGYRSGDNPARWKGHLENLLAATAKISKRKNQPALPWQRVPKFMAALHDREGVSARALEFLIMTAARASEVRFASWPEIDLDKRMWTIPAERMKARKEHFVPLSDAAISLLRALPRFDNTELVFPSGTNGKPMSDATLSAVIKRMNEGLEGADQYLDPANGRVIVPHGFRSSFRMWAAEATDHPSAVAEHALAHQLKDKVEAAYQRGSELPKRTRLMADWSAYVACPSRADNVIQLVG